VSSLAGGVGPQGRDDGNEPCTELLSARQSPASRRYGGSQRFASCRLHCRIAAHPVLADRFKYRFTVNARSGGPARRDASITVASEFGAQGCVSLAVHRGVAVQSGRSAQHQSFLLRDSRLPNRRIKAAHCVCSTRKPRCALLAPYSRRSADTNQRTKSQGRCGRRVANAQRYLKVHRPDGGRKMRNFRNQRHPDKSCRWLASEPNQALSPTAQPRMRLGSRAARRHAVGLAER
jgi:hypothetical protein